MGNLIKMDIRRLFLSKVFYIAMAITAVLNFSIYIVTPILSKFFTSKPLEDIKSDIALHDGDKITLGESVFTVISTPGHTSGSVCFVCDDKIFSGDTLFYRSHGRTDFPTGDEKAMLDSLNKLANLSGNYTVYPGHDMSTTLDSERKYNPYIGNNFYDNIY